MLFTLTDVILIAILVCFIAAGFIYGLIKSVGSLVGLAAGIWIASRYFMPLADWLTPILRGNGPLAKILAFIIVYIIINRLIVLIFHLLDKAFSLLSFIPFAKSLNRFGGVVLGIIEGVLTIGIIIYIIAKFAPDTGIVAALDGSQIAHYLVLASKFLTTLLPQAFEQIKSVF